MSFSGLLLSLTGLIVSASATWYKVSDPEPTHHWLRTHTEGIDVFSANPDSTDLVLSQDPNKVLADTAEVFLSGNIATDSTVVIKDGERLCATARGGTTAVLVVPAVESTLVVLVGCKCFTSGGEATPGRDDDTTRLHIECPRLGEGDLRRINYLPAMSTWEEHDRRGTHPPLPWAGAVVISAAGSYFAEPDTLSYDQLSALGLVAGLIAPEAESIELMTTDSEPATTTTMTIRIPVTASTSPIQITTVEESIATESESGPSESDEGERAPNRMRPKARAGPVTAVAATTTITAATVETQEFTTEAPSVHTAGDIGVRTVLSTTTELPTPTPWTGFVGADETTTDISDATSDTTPPPEMLPLVPSSSSGATASVETMPASVSSTTAPSTPPSDTIIPAAQETIPEAIRPTMTPEWLSTLSSVTAIPVMSTSTTTSITVKTLPAPGFTETTEAEDGFPSTTVKTTSVTQSEGTEAGTASTTDAAISELESSTSSSTARISGVIIPTPPPTVEETSTFRIVITGGTDHSGPAGLNSQLSHHSGTTSHNSSHRTEISRHSWRRPLSAHRRVQDVTYEYRSQRSWGGRDQEVSLDGMVDTVVADYTSDDPPEITITVDGVELTAPDGATTDEEETSTDGDTMNTDEESSTEYIDADTEEPGFHPQH